MTLPEQFIMERKIFKNVSPKTVIWYEQSLKRFDGASESKAAVGERILEPKECLSPVFINTALRLVNAYFMWLHKEHGKNLVRISRLKEEQKIIASFSSEHIAR